MAMSDERATEFVEGDFGGGEELREEFGAKNEVREGEELGAENEFGKEEGSYSAENDRETISASSSNRNKQMSIDRLSALPDSLLIRILAELDMKEAAITAVLSKRWEFLWTELPSLDFWETQKIRDFVTWVHRTLLFRSGIHLEKFRVVFRYHDCFASDVNAWVHFAVKNKVKELTLLLYSYKDYHTLPQVIYSNSSLTWLWMQRCIVAPQGTIEWQSLTSLKIKEVELHEHVIQKILSGCPVLRMLHLVECWGFKRLEINSQSLDSLGVAQREDKNSEPFLEISAPYIRTLNISLHPMGKKFHLKNIPSVVDADINFSVSDSAVEVMNNTIELFEKTQHVKELILGCGCIEVLSKLVVRGWRLPQSRRECLVLDTWRDEDSIPGIVGLLESSPNLDTLVIQCCDSYEESVKTWGPVARDDLDCDLLHLKTVRFIDYANPNLAGEPMLTMARILLKRATALEKMVIDAEEHLTKFSSDFTKIAQTVLGYPRSSKKAIVVLHE